MNQGNLNIYLVDDDAAVSQAVGLLLISRGFGVRPFSSGEAFLASANLQAGGCVILDLRMPGMGGVQVFEALRALGSPLVVLFQSGHGTIPLATQMVRRGAVGWLEMPPQDDELIGMVTEALDRAAIVWHWMQRWRSLTGREKEVALLTAKGFTSKEIGEMLVKPGKPAAESREEHVDPRTVDTHRLRAFAKLEVGSNELTEMLAQMRAWGFDLRDA